MTWSPKLSSPIKYAVDWFRHFVSLPVQTGVSTYLFWSSSSPGVMVANTHSVGARCVSSRGPCIFLLNSCSLVVWAASGLLGWTGASSFAELGSAIPQNGGAQGSILSFVNTLLPFTRKQHILRMHMAPSFHTFLHGQQSLLSNPGEMLSSVLFSQNI